MEHEVEEGSGNERELLAAREGPPNGAGKPAKEGPHAMRGAWRFRADPRGSASTAGPRRWLSLAPVKLRRR
jgi:hypothetical protein